MSRRRPHPRLARGAYRLPVVVTAAAVAAAWVWAPSAPNGSPTAAPRASFVDAAVRRLRAAVVGDVAPDGGPPNSAASPRARADRALAARVLAARAATRPAPAVTPGVPWWADSAHWGADVVLRRDETRPTLVAEAGDTVVVDAPPLPALLPEALRRRGVYWAVQGDAALEDARDDAPATVGANAARRVVVGAPGEVVVTATTPVGRATVPVRVRPVVRGRVYAADEQSPPRARVVVTRDGAAPDTAWTDAAGRFRLALPDGWAGGADVRVEPADATRGDDDADDTGHAPAALGRVDARRLHTLGVVLVPRRWAVRAGAYAGAAVPVRAALARGYWPVAGGAAPGAPRRAVGWADDAPRTVAFEPGGPAADTAAFWAAARALGRAWGRPLFLPAAAPADADVTVRVTPGLGAAGLTTLAWDAGSGAVVGGARVEFRTAAAAADARVVQHELLHVLGFGHARGWASVLAPAGASGALAATAADVAYGQLFEGVRRQARRAAREYGAAFGVSGA